MAIGYYNNFLGPVLDAFATEKTIEVIEKDATGKVIKKFRQKISDHMPTIEIRAPRNLMMLSRKHMHVRTKNYRQLIINTQVRPFPFYVEGSFNAKSRLRLFDIPTTLLASYFTMEKFFTPEFLAADDNLQRLMFKEIRNFEKTLGKLIPGHVEHQFYSFKIV